MKCLNFYVGNQVHLGIVEKDKVFDMTANAQLPQSMEELIRSGSEAFKCISEYIRGKSADFTIDNIKYAPAICNPSKILCVGLNYLEHAEEACMDLTKIPTIFSKFTNALAAHEQKIVLPKTAKQYDYEAELVIVIGKAARNISKENALDYVFGYTIGNDLSARDLQLQTTQWLIGKTLDGFAPVGPYIVTADELNPNDLKIQCYVNGKLRQNSHTSLMIFDCAAIISYISQYVELQPGDIIFTGTPSGVIIGYPKENQVWLTAGDEVMISIQGIGELTNIMTE
ncbi:fumarylacetoacetate hydrolase family protein [Acetivibrio cellulolyticus]|uniref:fumarylacetoacetate hydrolase family protein n=1 Tax=Acetivibrio cellulolyticus TaxID=35830 RepID=UPI0001E2E732|nr:fumarylacetoacetate hydrolase family protein [Acetivibrio cellulolyticus]